MNAETKPALAETADAADGLVLAAGLLALAIDGLKELTRECELSEHSLEALEFGARIVEDRAEQLAAMLGHRDTRWLTELATATAP